ncbi:MAG: M15 family metallopeptidase [Actinomycetota bacterium]
MRLRWATSAPVSIALGVAVGIAVVLSGAALSRDHPTAQSRPRHTSSPSAIVTDRPPKANTILLAWAAGGLPARTQAVLEKHRGVIDATTVLAGLDWIDRSHASDGAVIDKPPHGLAIPFEMAFVDPVAYRAFVPVADRQTVESLRPDELLLARTEAGLRGAGEGLTINLSGRHERVAGVVSDQATQGYEALAAGHPPNSWLHPDRYVLLRVNKKTNEDSIARAIRKLLPNHAPVRVKAQGETPFLRYGDAVLPQMLYKKTFGEFAARPTADGRLDIDPKWIARNIVRARVPLLGTVECHRLMIPQLRRALREIRAEGFGYQIDPAQFAGCFSPRFISSDPRSRLSHHAWGAAIDLNAAENRFGARPTMPRSIVQIMERNGFTWGGRWIVPDGMHFEWARFP